MILVFRTRIRELRERAGYRSQQAFANAFGVAQTTVAGWEGGKREPNYETTIRLANFFGVPLGYLLGQEMVFETFEPISILFSYYKSLTVKLFSEITGISQTVSEQLSIVATPFSDSAPGKNPLYYTLTDQQLQNIHSFFEIDTSTFRSETTQTPVFWSYSAYERLLTLSSPSLPDEAIPVKSSHLIPVLGQIAAGLPLYAEEHIEGYIYTEDHDGGECFGLRVRDDSMNAAKIHGGDLAIIQRCDMVENGTIAVVLVDGEATIKRYHREHELVILSPQSTDPEHQVRFYSLRDHSIRILGRVIEARTTL